MHTCFFFLPAFIADAILVLTLCIHAQQRISQSWKLRSVSLYVSMLHERERKIFEVAAVKY